MAHGTRGREDGDVREALDRCLARMRRGESLDRCLADHSSLSDELRPLLQLAASISGGIAEAPPSPGGLADGRRRLLDAAGNARRTAEESALADLTADERAIAFALDEALAAVHAGAAPDEVLAQHPEHADALRPLLGLARAMRGRSIQPPAPPTRLERGRDRLRTAIADARDAAAIDAARADGDASLTEAVDACVAGVCAGSSVDDVLAAHPNQAEQLRPMAAMAQHLASRVVEPPPADLAAGRRAMLDAARLARAPMGLKHGLAVLFGPGRALSAARLAAAAIALLLMMAGGGMAIAPAAASSLPGDTLYNVKRAGEQVRLALAFDPSARLQLEADFSRERDREIDALLESGRTGEVDRWQVRFRGLEDRTDDAGNRRGLLHVILLDDPQETRSLAWDAETEFDLGNRYDAWTDVPSGERLTVKVLIRTDSSPLALSVRLLDADEPTETSTPTGSVTPDGTTMPLATQTISATATATTITRTATPTELTATATATVAPTPTVTPTTQSGMPSVDVRLRDTLRGVLESKTNDTTWMVVDEPDDRSADQPGTKVPVDVSSIARSDRDRVNPGDWVQLHGRWQSEKRALFLARSLDRVRSASGAAPEKQCTTHTAVGRVANIDTASITLLDGSVYDTSRMPPDALAPLSVGTRVEVVYQDCGGGERIAQIITVLDQPATGVYQGTVDGAGKERFTLVLRSGARYSVVYDAATTISGADNVEDGLFAQVRGWRDDDQAIHAEEILLRRPATPTAPSPTASPSPGGTATTVPTGSATGAPTAVTPSPTTSWAPEGTPDPGPTVPAAVRPTVEANR